MDLGDLVVLQPDDDAVPVVRSQTILACFTVGLDNNVVAIADRVAECKRFVVDGASNADTDFALFHQALKCPVSKVRTTFPGRRAATCL